MPASAGAGIDSAELQRRLAAFPDWLYEIDLGGGVRTPVANRTMVNRQHERRRYFFEALLSLTGGSLTGRRVLDLGCGAGYWSLAALDAGAEFVLAVDATASSIEQTRLVLEARRIAPSRYELRQGNAVSPPAAASRSCCVSACSAMWRVRSTCSPRWPAPSRS